MTWKKLFNLLYFGIFVAFVLGQFQRLQIDSRIAIYGHEILIGIILCTWLLFSLIKKSTLKIPEFILYSIPFVITIYLSLLVNFPRFGLEGSFVGLLYALRLSMMLVFAAATYDLVSKKIVTVLAIPNLIITSLVSIFLGFAQYIFYPDTRFLYLLGWDDHLNRIIGTYFDPGFTGLIFCLLFILFYIRHLKYEKTSTSSVRHPRRGSDSMPGSGISNIVSILFGKSNLRDYRHNLNLAGIVLSTLALFLTYSRASFLTFAVILMSALIFFKNKKLALQILRLSVVLIFMLPSTEGEGVNLQRSYSVESRIETTVSAGEVFKDNVIFGIGFNNYPKITTVETIKPYHPSAPDNSYLFVLATTGIVGGISFVYWVGRSLWYYKDHFIIFLSLIAISTHSLFNNSWFYTFVLLWLGLVVSIYDKDEQSWSRVT